MLFVPICFKLGKEPHFVYFILCFINILASVIFQASMPQSQLNSLVVTSSGIFGGLTKALSANIVLLNITFQGILQVGFYAAISALVGYGVKAGIDQFINYINKRR